MTAVKKRKGHKKMWIVIGVILGVLVIGAFIAMMAFEPGRREAMAVTVGRVDFSKLADGVFEGQYQGTKDHLRDAKVAVTVAAGQVEKISVIGGAMANEKQHSEIRNGQSLDTLFQRVIDAGSLQVDTISGATITSKVHLKAVQNALEQAESDIAPTVP